MSQDDPAVEPSELERAASLPWHARPAEAVLSELATRPSGLSSEEARRNLEKHGPNVLPAGKKRTALVRFLSQFRNLLIYVLLAAALVTALLGHAVDTAVILLVVIANAVIGFLQEGRAERALDAIMTMVSPMASVLRDGRRATVSAGDLVPGDIVLLEAGDRAPADLRLIRARNLRIDEAILTGESVPVEKTADAVPATSELADRTCMAFSGSLITTGQGVGVVVATGTLTEMGRIGTLLGKVQELTTPLLRQMNQFATRLTGVILAVSAIVFAISTTVHGTPLTDAFLAVVGLAVAAIPEGLPAVMTITLAIGVQRMAKRHAIIRRLPAVETLGAVSVICSDKTGTLTRNEMMVQTIISLDGIFHVTGDGYAPDGEFHAEDRRVAVESRPLLSELLRGGCLCNDADLRKNKDGWSVDGDPMEAALVSVAMKGGMDPQGTRACFSRIDEVPFDAQHRFMASLHRRPQGGAVLYVKGAPERVVAMCSSERSAHRKQAVNPGWWLAEADAAARQGQRVIGLAMKELPSIPEVQLTLAHVDAGLTMLGLFGLLDPPREEARTAVHECQLAGIKVKMITGDHAVTAGAIAEKLGIRRDGDGVLTGLHLDGLADGEFESAVSEASVFARTSPEHKLRIVRALQSRGDIVAMTGDGVNDAPSLKQADVGVAMGRKGTEAAKEAAEMVLADDNFASIVAAVYEGRTVYDNLKKVIAWTLPTNGGEALAVISAMLLGLTLPITPAQILWINMITAAALGLTLAFEPPEQNVMRRLPRRPDEPILSGFLIWRVAFVSVLIVFAVFGMFTWTLRRGLPLEHARTVAVNTIVVMEIFYLFSVRYLYSASISWTGVLGTSAVLIGVAAVVLAQLAFTYLGPMQDMFETRSLTIVEGIAVVAVGIVLLLVLEGEKAFWRFFFAAK